ncbi:MAG: deoxyguanosinetriphosphate triphosphohydrolase [Myxococcota bacterium]|nr:deoxyguanosinetriphosphate triphosphohydrolase [Myxococcota bacterium]
MSALRDRVAFAAEERERLAPWAVASAASRGRVVPEPEHPLRTGFQRDRDRVLHSRAFRRLEYKTQVFVHHEGDHYRNRLTHTLEGAQIARTIARALRLNEDLAEAVALAHDLGHTPFGHAGERVLARLLRADGGFDHNRQTLRVVDLLEDRYPTFRGLNLSYETREGILKHGVAFAHPVTLPDRSGQTPLEAQAADHADEIAYTNHDLDDGLRSGLLDPTALEEVPLWRRVHEETRARIGDAPESVQRAQTIVTLINRLVTDLVEATAARLDAASPRDVDGVRRAGDRLMRHSPAIERGLHELKEYLYRNLYHHPAVLATTDEAERVLEELWHVLCNAPDKLPVQVRARFDEDGATRAITDYVAGMTDRFALAEHRRLTDGRDVH